MVSVANLLVKIHQTFAPKRESTDHDSIKIAITSAFKMQHSTILNAGFTGPWGQHRCPQGVAKTDEHPVCERNDQLYWCLLGQIIYCMYNTWQPQSVVIHGQTHSLSFRSRSCFRLCCRKHDLVFLRKPSILLNTQWKSDHNTVCNKHLSPFLFPPDSLSFFLSLIVDW